MKVTIQVGDSKKMTVQEAREYLGPEKRREMAKRMLNERLKSIKGAKVTLQ